jgi:tetratricopeptide (TPR) repeat protein
LTQDWSGAQADVAKALTLDSGSSAVQIGYGDLLASLGRLPEAIAAQRKGVELDPLSSGAWNFLGVYLTAYRELAAARKPLMRALEISPDSEFALANLVVLDLLSGQAPEALAAARQIHSSVWGLYALALSEHSLGHAAESERALRALISDYSQTAAYQIAEAYAWRGEKSRAFEWLERAYRQHDNGLGTLKYSPLLDDLGSDLRFAELLRKTHLPQ